MKRIALFCMLFLPVVAWAQKQYYLPTAGATDDDKDKPMIEVYLPQQPNGCAVVLCPGGAMRWLSWESDVVKMASFLNEQGIAAIGLRYHLNKTPMPQGMKMPPMVDVTHPEVFPQADANPMHTASSDSIIRLAEQDAKAAIRMVRQHADEWNISKDKIGYLGFSAGGGVAIAATMSADSMERPNFLCRVFHRAISRTFSCCRQDVAERSISRNRSHSRGQSMIQNYKIVTLCGSTRFKEQFLEAQKRLTLEGCIVISVGLFGHSGDDEVWKPGTKEMVDDMHLRKIDLADEIFVINVGGYIGESTRREIAYAEKTGKKVRYLEE